MFVDFTYVCICIFWISLSGPVSVWTLILECDSHSVLARNREIVVLEWIHLPLWWQLQLSFGRLFAGFCYYLLRAQLWSTGRVLHWPKTTHRKKENKIKSCLSIFPNTTMSIHFYSSSITQVYGISIFYPIVQSKCSICCLYVFLLCIHYICYLGIILKMEW